MGIAVLAIGLDLGFGLSPEVAYEEGRNARAALMFSCGHWEEWRTLQYRPFCGGCTVDAVVAAPLFVVFGPTVGVWKLVPAAWAVGVCLLIGALATRLGGIRAGIGASLLALAVPPAIRELALIGWGNHAEGLVFPLLGAFVLVGERPGPWVRALVGGLLGGFGSYYAHSTSFFLPALVLCAPGLGPRVVLVASLLVGFSPFILWHDGAHTAAGSLDAAADLWGGRLLAPPAELWRFLVTDLLGWGRLYPTTGPLIGRIVGENGAGALGVVLAVGGALCCVGGMGLVLWEQVRGRRRPAALLVVALLSLVAIYGVRFDLWRDVPALLGPDAFHLRYRVGLFVLGPLLGGLLTARWWPFMALAVVLSVGGTLFRVEAWTVGASRGGLEVGAPAARVDGAPNPTVPEGDPPVRRAEAQYRTVDRAAAARFLAEAEGVDVAPACRAHAAAELGRRWGLAVRHDPSARAAVVREIVAYLPSVPSTAGEEQAARLEARWDVVQAMKVGFWAGLGPAPLPEGLPTDWATRP